jgi:hypothetical protein
VPVACGFAQTSGEIRDVLAKSGRRTATVCSAMCLLRYISGS